MQICASIGSAPPDEVFADARAGPHQIDCSYRLDQEVGYPHLQQRAGDILIEALRNRDHRRPGAHARHQPRQRLHLLGAPGIEIDHHDRGALEVERIALLGHAPRDHGEINRAASAECGAHRTIELGVGGKHHDTGTI